MSLLRKSSLKGEINLAVLLSLRKVSYSNSAFRGADISLLVSRRTASRINPPPASPLGENCSPNRLAPNTTVTTGSMVESIAAFVGPTRSNHAINETAGITVAINTMPATVSQPES